MSEAVTNPLRDPCDKTETPTTQTGTETRTINVEVPQSIYWRVRECATESRLPMKEYMARLCAEAWPYPPEPDARMPIERQDETQSPSECPVEHVKTINVEVPEYVYWHIRKCATESRLSMKAYMTKFCEEGWIYPQVPQQITAATNDSDVNAAAHKSNQETNR